MEEKFKVDASLAFDGRSIQKLRRSKLLFSIVRSPLVVKVLSFGTKWALKLGLPVEGIVKSTVFDHFCAGVDLADCKNSLDELSKNKIGAILDYSVEGKGTEEDFDRTTREVIAIIRKAAADPAIPYSSLKMTGLARAELLQKVSEEKMTSPEENDELDRINARLDEIFTEAFKHGVPVFIDAEESWIQPAIDSMAENMMLRYNRQRFVVLTTVQLYRTDRLDYLRKLIGRCKDNGILAGVKLVRGAYHEKEQERARKMNYPCPVFKNKEDSDQSFNEAVSLCLDNVEKVMVCVGTHNEESTYYMVEEMEKRGIPPDHPHVYSSQLYGMSDPITWSLAAKGYNVTKYLPYGPVKSVIPYLIRRAEENTSIGGQAGRELEMIRQAIRKKGTERA